MDEVTQIREKIDIVSLISEYVPLKKMGRNFKANCPFHHEKTPSFVVSAERQIWHCFGCSKGGDAYSFLMQYEHLEFPEALRILAKKAGIEIKDTRDFQKGAVSKKEKIYKINNLSLEFYHYLLTKHNAGKKALDYLLEQRELNKGTIETFMLGFAPSIGNALVNYLLTKKGYKREDLIEAGIAKPKAFRPGARQGDISDFFQGRIIFPLFDHRGNVVAFSGRVFSDTSFNTGSKYINTRDTIVYHKQDNFFGINIAKNAIKEEDKVIVVEGEFDVISLFQEGIKNVVAVKGSSLTENQVNLLSRFTKKVSLCFDMDKAGQDAIKRSLTCLEKKSFTTFVITTPDGKDPDESVRKESFSFKKAIKEENGIYDYLIDKAVAVFDKKTVEGKRKIGEETIPLLMGIENEIVKEFYIKRISRELDISFESIQRQMDKIKGKEIVGKNFEPDFKSKKTREEMFEEYFASLIIQSQGEDWLMDKVEVFLKDYKFKTLSYEKILSRIVDFVRGEKNFDVKEFLKVLPQELVKAFDTCYLFPIPKFDDDKHFKEEIEKIIKELKVTYLKTKIQELSDSIKLKEKEGNLEEIDILRSDFSTNLKLLQELSL